jgi:hypothetical protein
VKRVTVQQKREDGGTGEERWDNGEGRIREVGLVLREQSLAPDQQIHLPRGEEA